MRAFLSGFFRDPPSTDGKPGKASMTRLMMFGMLVASHEVVATICWIAIKHPTNDKIIMALGGILITLVVNGVVALRNRKQTGEQP